MQRVRIGLTGLAGVFLLVVFAAAFFGMARRGSAPDLGSAVRAENLAANAQGDAREPLAELGVTPGNEPDEAANLIAAPFPPAAASPAR